VVLKTPTSGLMLIYGTNSTGLCYSMRITETTTAVTDCNYEDGDEQQGHVDDSLDNSLMLGALVEFTLL